VVARVEVERGLGPVDSEYARVGNAIADVMFGSESAGRPVYALPDAETLSEILAIAEVDGRDAAALASVVRQTLRLDDTGVAPFRWHEDRSQLHKDDPLETPPALPLLVLLAAAAEQMQRDSDLAAHNYYSRLHRLLSVPHESRHRVESSYRQTADLLWGSLNLWLEAWEGERGIPTAYAIGGHPFIGLPMSQAVVRQHDRTGLHEMFILEGLSPGIRVSPSDMSRTLDSYATVTPSPLSSHLSRLWRAPASRDRIVEAACLELEVWDGSGIESMAANRRVAATRLLAFLRAFPSKSIEFNLMLPYHSQEPGVARFALSDGETALPTVAGPGGSTRLASVGATIVGLVDEQLDGRLGDDERCPFARRPKRVTPLRWDGLQGAFVEVECISLGEDSIVLVRSDARVRVEKHFAAHARPGWRELAELPGTPEGWRVYQHVQIISAPSGPVHVDLLPLAPRARTSLTLRAGFVLPGLLRKWSTMEPPEAVGVAAGAHTVEVKVYEGTRMDLSQPVAQALEDGELVVLPLSGIGLADGEYVVAMFVDGSGTAASRALLRLRSANTPQLRVEDTDIRLVYSPDSSPRWPLTAGPAKWSRYINGARTVDMPACGSLAKSSMSEFVPRQRRKGPPPPRQVKVGLPMPSDSCLATGMHRWDLPPVLPGQRATRSIRGECETCGLVRRFAGTPWAARKRVSSREAAPTPIVPPIVEATRPDFEVALDALNHVGTGSLGVFHRVAAQLEGSEPFADSFLRSLEVVGHIDVARAEYMQVTEWAVNRPTLVPVGERRWVLIGFRSTGLLRQIAELLGSKGKVSATADAGIVRTEVNGVLPVPALLDLGVQVLDVSPARVIASGLPHLSQVAAVLKRVVVPQYRSAEFWDTKSASWRPAETLACVGAYRLRHFGPTYAIRSSEDVDRGTIGIGNAQVVKHIANLWEDDPLVGYHSRSGSVVAPLGADLPTLYGRALSLCSGLAPREIPQHRMLQYPSVPREIADIIFDRVRQ
jgi:hypothetical protein